VEPDTGNYRLAFDGAEFQSQRLFVGGLCCDFLHDAATGLDCDVFEDSAAIEQHVETAKPVQPYRKLEHWDLRSTAAVSRCSRR
jgi:hypothetical protein